jgi:two-component system, NtrC family, sensor histidine kinase HydH
MATNSSDLDLAELAGGFIHEIKNHLSTLGLNLELLAEEFAAPETQRERRAGERIKRLQGECQRLVDVSNDFLRFARIRDLNFQPTSIRSVIEEMVDFYEPMATAGQIEIITYLPASLPEVPLDAELFKQALLNLFLNAGQAMPEGGELILQACAEEGQWARLDVIDTGCGIAPEVRDKLFRPFHTTKPGGNGLGLPTVKRIIEAHGGTIDVQSTPGHGTKFAIRVPIPKVEP